jgi:hypothetical protein
MLLAVEEDVLLDPVEIGFLSGIAVVHCSQDIPDYVQELGLFNVICKCIC